jgi:hypothetical protein
MLLLNAAMAGVLVAAAATEKPAVVVAAPDSPVKIDKATVLTVEGAPPLIFYSATNQTENDLEQFTVMVFIFDPTGFLKIEQIAPGRRLLEAKTTKYSTIVLDVAPVDPNATIVIGVNQAQRLNSDNWWKADIKAAAEAAVPRKKP